MPKRTTRKTKTRKTTNYRYNPPTKRTTPREATCYETVAGPTRPAWFNTDWFATQTWKTINNVINTIEYNAAYTFNKIQKWSGYRGKPWATRFTPQTSWNNDLAKWANGVVNAVKYNTYNWVKHSKVIKDVVEMAVEKKNDIFTKLDIPSQYEVDELQRKIATLEQRFTSVAMRNVGNR